MPELDRIELSSIYISPENVRKSNRDADIEELAENIAKVGLLQPVVVVRDGDRYELIVGQRRLLALQMLRERGKLPDTLIPALVYPPLDREQKMILSLAENLQRKQLPFNDAVAAVGHLYQEYGSVRRVARELGVSEPTVYKYLRMGKLPEEIRRMVQDKRIRQADAERALLASKGDTRKAVEIARHLPRMTTDQKMRLVALAEARKDVSVDDLVKEAKARVREYRVTIVLPERYYGLLQSASKALSLDLEATATKAVVEWLRDMGYEKG